MAANSKAVTRKDIQTYISATRDALSFLKYHLDNHDWDAVERTAHDVAGYAGEVENLAETYASQELAAQVRQVTRGE